MVSPLTVATSGTGVGEGGTGVSVGMNVGETDGIMSVGRTEGVGFPDVHAARNPIIMAGIKSKPGEKIRNLISNRLYTQPDR
jgi:hypothetical protein